MPDGLGHRGYARGSWINVRSERALRHFPYRSVATFPLQDQPSERCDISLNRSFKDFVATLVLLGLD